MENLETKIAALQAQLDNANKVGESVEGLKSELAEKQAAIANLDASVKEQAEEIKSLRKSLETSARKTLGQILREKKAYIEEKMASGANRFSVEVKAAGDFAAANIVNNTLSLQLDTNVAAPARPAFAGIDVLGISPRTADKLSWVEADMTEAVGYVGELIGNTNKTTGVLTQVNRNFAKLVTQVAISTEMVDWLEFLVDWVENEGKNIVLNKFDAELFKGDSASGHIYGLVSNNTPFAAQATGVADANIKDVITQAISQAKKNGRNADVVFCSYASEWKLRNIKDADGNYIYNPESGMIGQVRVHPTINLTDDQLIVMDRACARPFAGNSYELEFARNANLDGWDVYFRLAGQQKITAAGKEGIIYVANITTAITAIAA